jgi:putative heme-binding domain-containing protein
MQHLSATPSPEYLAALRSIAINDPQARDTAVWPLCGAPTSDDFAALVAGLQTPSKPLLLLVVEALKKCPGKPKADDAAPYRALLLASGKLDDKQRWKAVEVLRHWSNNRQFGADDGDWKPELTSWRRWFGQAFPKEPELPDTTIIGGASKYKFEELLAFLEKEGKTGNAVKGKTVFDKAQCAKCHKYGKEGEGAGPDLTNVSRRFKRDYILESILYPSKVISDQYRSRQIVTKKGVQYLGLVAEAGDTLTILQQDGNKVTIKKSEVESQFDSLVSVMPEKLLDGLTKEEIADLFAYMESEPK